MGESNLKALSCTCALCLSWKRLGALISSGHSDQEFRRLATDQVRRLESELLDYGDTRGKAHQALAGAVVSTAVPRKGQPTAKASAKETSPEESEEEESESEEESAPKPGPTKAKETPVKDKGVLKVTASKTSPSTLVGASAKSKAEKGHIKEENYQETGPLGEARVSRSRSRERRKREHRQEERPRSPKERKPHHSSSSRPSGSRPSSASARTGAKKEEAGERREDRLDRPPGRWGLTPQPPAFPPPPRLRLVPKFRPKRNKGQARVRRLEDIHRYGPSAERKQKREEERWRRSKPRK